VRRLALALIAVYGVQLAVGVLNMWLLAPVALQLVHLLLSDGVWILLVLLGAAVLAVDPAERRAGT
jgi:heme A synthase